MSYTVLHGRTRSYTVERGDLDEVGVRIPDLDRGHRPDRSGPATGPNSIAVTECSKCTGIDRSRAATTSHSVTPCTISSTQSRFAWRSGESPRGKQTCGHFERPCSCWSASGLVATGLPAATGPAAAELPATARGPADHLSRPAPSRPDTALTGRGTTLADRLTARPVSGPAAHRPHIDTVTLLTGDRVRLHDPAGRYDECGPDRRVRPERRSVQRP